MDPTTDEPTASRPATANRLLSFWRLSHRSGVPGVRAQAAAAASACGWFVEEGDWRGEVPMGDRRGEVRGLSHVLLRARTKPTAELTRGDAVELDLLKAGEAEGEECC